MKFRTKLDGNHGRGGKFKSMVTFSFGKIAAKRRTFRSYRDSSNNNFIFCKKLVLKSRYYRSFTAILPTRVLYEKNENHQILTETFIFQFVTINYRINFRNHGIKSRIKSYDLIIWKSMAVILVFVV